MILDEFLIFLAWAIMLGWFSYNISIMTPRAKKTWIGTSFFAGELACLLSCMYLLLRLSLNFY